MRPFSKLIFYGTKILSETAAGFVQIFITSVSKYMTWGSHNWCLSSQIKWEPEELRNIIVPFYFPSEKAS